MVAMRNCEDEMSYFGYYIILMQYNVCCFSRFRISLRFPIFHM